MGAVRSLSELGPRLSVRRRLPDGRGGDVVGHVVQQTSDHLVLLPEDRGEVVVARSDVLASRLVPERTVHPAGSAADVARLVARCWPGVEQARLGGWRLRAGGGVTRRANSVVVVGDPGVGVDEAVELVTRWYADRGLPALFSVPQEGPSPLPGRELCEVGAADVMVADLRRRGAPVVATGPGAGDAGPRPSSSTGWTPLTTDHPTAAWLGLWRSGAAESDAGLAAELTSTPAEYHVVPDPHGAGGGAAEALAVARTVRVGRWVHVSCVEVRPDVRRRGMARALTNTLLDRARSTGAAFAVLEVDAATTGAAQLYRELGFAPHHRYAYLAPAAGDPS